MKRNVEGLFEECLNNCKELASSKEFWKGAALFVAIVLLIYTAYIIVEYWPEITDGFNRGWNSR